MSGFISSRGSKSGILGYDLAPANPVFRATKANQTIPNDNKTLVTWNSAPLNVGGHFDISTELFTVPIAGLYFFTFGLDISSIPSDVVYCISYIVKNLGGGDEFNVRQVNEAGDASGTTHTPTAVTALLYLDVGDNIRAMNEIYHGSGTVGPNVIQGTEGSWFSGCLIG